MLRPASLLVAVAPVVAGTAIGYARTGRIDAVAVLLVLFAAVLVQAVSNMQNDVGYTLRGAERSGTRRGLPRATANGWLRVADVRAAIVVAAIVAAGIGVALAAYRGPLVLVVGALSLGGALAYMAGPRPIAYTPFGEATVFAFFGVVAVVGTDWVITGSVGIATVVAAAAIGCLAAAALCVNNHRDIAHDRAVGRRTFAVAFGADASRRLYRTLMTVPFVLLPPMVAAARIDAPSRAGGFSYLLPLVLAPAAWRLYRDFVHCPPGIAFNAILFRTFRLGLAFASLVALGAVLDRVAA